MAGRFSRDVVASASIPKPLDEDSGACSGVVPTVLAVCLSSSVSVLNGVLKPFEVDGDDCVLAVGDWLVSGKRVYFVEGE